MRTKSGGSAALHGFLYQLLAHLDWAVRLTVTPSGGDDFNLVLEPLVGSDAEIALPGRRLIEQYKTRSGGTWSLKDITHGAIADFVRSAEHRRLPHDDFRFVTDGRVSHQGPFLAFLDRVAADSCSPPNTLIKRHYRTVGTVSDAELVEWIRTELSRKPGASHPDIDVVMHVLARTKLKGEIEEAAMRSRLECYLRRCLAVPDEAPEKIQALLGSLLDFLSVGPLEINAREFLRAQGIDTERPERLASLNKRLHTNYASAVTRGSHAYRRLLDVRTAPPWALEDHPILALSGRAGIGKSWQLMRLGYELGERGLPCVHVPLQSDVTRTLDVAARTMWNDVLQTLTPCDISSLRQALRAQNYPTEVSPWLVCLIDGPLDHAGVSQLVDHAARDPDIRFAVTVPSDVGERLRTFWPSQIAVCAVGGFTDDQLMCYLDLHNRAWKDLPPDLFALLKQPLLASLYVRSSPTTFDSAPQSEYALFDEFWRGVSDKKEGRAAVGQLRRLARRFFEQPLLLALPIEDALEGVGETVLRALTDSGWLETDWTGQVRFAHDRLMNWAWADAVVMALGADRVAEDAIFPTLKLPVASVSRWNYVLMDVVWKLCATDSGCGIAARLFKAHTAHETGIPDHALYGEIVPTLGPRAYSLLHAMLEEGVEENFFPHLTQLVRDLGTQHRASQELPRLLEYARAWMDSPNPLRVQLGLTLVESGGFGSLAELVYQLHLKHARDLRSASRPTTAYESSFSALKVCVHERPDWLDSALSNAGDAETLGALSWQLVNLEDVVARELWARHCHRLVALTGPDHVRGTLACVRRFRDTAWVDFVRSAVASSEDFVSGVAFETLAIVAPQTALELLDSLAHSTEILLWRKAWFASLHQALPDAAEDWLIRHLGEGLTYELFGLVEPQASTRLKRAAMACFQRTVSTLLSSDAPWIHLWKTILLRMRDRSLLRDLQATPTEDLLVGIAMRRIDPVRTWHDHLLEDVRQVLIAIGGEGVSRLLAHELKHTQGRQAYVALQLAPMVPWPGIEGALVDHVASVANTDMDTRRISVIFALHALASLDFTEELIALVRTQEPELVHRQSIDIRRGAAPFAPHHVSTIAKRLASAGLSDSELLRELLLAALSQAPELVPAIEKQLHESSDVRTFRYASHALLALDACSESTALAARRWLDNRNGSKLALRLLLRCDTPACHRVVLDFVRGQVATNPMVVAWVIPYLPNEGPLGAEADALAVDIFRRTPMATDAYSRVIRTGDVELVSSLRLLAFRREEGLVGMQPAAICALQQLDPVDAVEAALNMLRQGTSHDEFGAQFIMRQGSHDQCLRLVELAQTLGRDGLWAHCGRALRRRSPDSQIALMAQWRTSESLSAARAFAEMAGWLGPTYLKEVTDRLSLEHRRSICRALEQASTRITQLDTLEHHLQSLHDAEGPERLALLTACLAAGEPFLLATSSDPLGIARALAPHPSYFRAYAENELEQLCKKWKPPKG